MGLVNPTWRKCKSRPRLVVESIVNPAKLSPWLADNICMSCHQIGDARVPQAGKQYRDFRPGTALDDTFAVFLVPFGPGSAPKDDLLEHYLSMRLSKCYRNSQGKLGCISCHDPHVAAWTRGSSRLFPAEMSRLSHGEKLRRAADHSTAEKSA